MIVQNNSSELNVCELDLYELTVCDYLKWVYVPMIDSQLMEITVGYPMYPDTKQYSSLIVASCYCVVPTTPRSGNFA